MNQLELKAVMRGKARLFRGLVNLLEYDAERIFSEVDDLDAHNLEETIRETKRTMQQLMDVSTDIEYCMRLVNRDE